MKSLEIGTMKLDAMGGMIMLDNFMSDMLRNSFAVHNVLLEANTPHAMSGAASIPKTVVANSSNWVHDHNPTDRDRRLMDIYAV